MALFNFKKKTEQQKSAPCCCGQKSAEDAKSVSSCCSFDAQKDADICCGEKVDGICCIKVLGSGCKTCHTLYENAKKAATAAGIGIEVEYVTDMEKIMSYGVMSMPALVVNDKVVSCGKLLKPEDIIKLLQ